jgi:hypothetical protein
MPNSLLQTGDEDTLMSTGNDGAFGNRRRVSSAGNQRIDRSRWRYGNWDNQGLASFSISLIMVLIVSIKAGISCLQMSYNCSGFT